MRQRRLSLPSEVRIMEKRYMTWEEFDYCCKEIAEFVKSSRIEIKNIYGVPRGGLMVAVRLSHLLDKPIIIQEKDIEANTLIADDIVDTGKTTEKYREKGLIVVSLWYNPSQCPHVPLVWIFEKTDKWIVFPWEEE
jgi:hypoxanthine phosphoribosyltransferase